jgi:hypothetical protein
VTAFELSFQVAPGPEPRPHEADSAKSRFPGTQPRRQSGAGVIVGEPLPAVGEPRRGPTTERLRRAGGLDPARGETYWHIRELSDSSPRRQELIYNEADLQAGRLDDLRGEVEALEARLNAREGLLAVIDTNVLLEHQRPEQVKWSEVLKASPVRLVIPLRVFEELDEKKYTARDDKAYWARRLLRMLGLGPAKGGPAPLAEGVTVEVPVDRRPRRRAVDADQEVLDTCETVTRVGGLVVLVTGDCGMAIRASALGIPVELMPEK